MPKRRQVRCESWRNPLRPQLPRRGEEPDTFAGLLGPLSKGTGRVRMTREKPQIHPLGGVRSQYGRDRKRATRESASETRHARPRWEHWVNISNPETWEALALSLNREPTDMMDEYGQIALLNSSGRRCDERAEYAVYLDRAHQVLDAAGWASINNTDPNKRWVAMKWPTNLGTVAVLAHHWGWECPKEFLALAARAPCTTRAKLIERHEHHWPAIERDLADASTNDLARAKLGDRGWIEPLALAWAATNGRLTGDDAPLSALDGVMKRFGSR